MPNFSCLITQKDLIFVNILIQIAIIVNLWYTGYGKLLSPKDQHGKCCWPILIKKRKKEKKTIYQNKILTILKSLKQFEIWTRRYYNHFFYNAKSITRERESLYSKSINEITFPLQIRMKILTAIAVVFILRATEASTSLLQLPSE